MLIVFWQASALLGGSAILEKGSPGRDQDKFHDVRMFIVTTARAASWKGIQGAPFIQEFRGHLLCNTNSGAPLMQKTKSKNMNKIWTYTRNNHPSQNERIDRIHAQWFPTDYNTFKSQLPPKTKHKTIQIRLSTAISATHWCPRVKFLEGSSVNNPIFFMTFPNRHRYSPSIDCIQIRSINWLYSVKRAQGTPMSRRFPD